MSEGVLLANAHDVIIGSKGVFFTSNYEA